MSLLSRNEELVLLAIWTLQDEAYTIPMQRHLERISGHTWSLGAIYSPIERLVRRGFLDSRTTDPTPRRGGRAKRIYRLTTRGRKALVDIRRVEEAAWKGITILQLSGTGS